MPDGRSFENSVRVVVEGPSRVIWNRVGERQWQFAGLWPNEAEQRDLRSHLRSGGALLVVVSDLSTTVQALAAELGVVGSDQPGDEVVDIAVPFLDWMEPGLRRASIDQIRALRDRHRATPGLLRPPLVLAVSTRSDRIVFAVRTSVARGELSAAVLRELAGYAFDRTEVRRKSLSARVAARIGLSVVGSEKAS